MRRDQAEYEIFLSYARRDNADGWVKALREQIIADHRRYSTEPMRIFFDTSEIKDMNDWRHRLLGALKTSRVLLICLSPNYFSSGPCRWEWDEYLARQTRQLLDSETFATVYFVEVPGSNEHDNARRLDELLRHNFTDLRPWFPCGPIALQEAEVRARMDALGQSLWERIERSRKARSTPGNLRRMTPYFVGRREELRDLHQKLGVGAIGVVTAVHGLGGQGKTELALAYATGYADDYPAGIWSLLAENKKELLPLLAELAYLPAFDYAPSEEERRDANLLGRAVLHTLNQRGSSLLILDNVSEADLLGPAQLATLGPPADRVRLVATTRLGPERLAHSAKQLACVAVDSLSEFDALTLLRDHQPEQEFPSPEEETAAREIVRDLGGFTLAVEQVAVYLGLNAKHEPPSVFLKRLRADGLPSVDDLPNDADVARQMLHQQKQLGPILRSTLDALTAELPAALTVLRLASLLPPDVVAWPWLRELTARHHPELTDRPAAWARIERRLIGLRLLIGSDRDEIARMHRLVAAHLQRDTAAALAEELRRFVGQRADAIYFDQNPPAEWELDALVETIPHLLGRNPDRDLANAGTFLVEKVLPYRPLPVSRGLLNATHIVIRRLATSDPNNAAWQRDLSVSLEKLGDLAVAQGNLPEAQRLFGECLKLRQRLATSDPNNAAWQRDLSYSYYVVGQVLMKQELWAEALPHLERSLAIDERLAASDPTNVTWQKDVRVSRNLVAQVRAALGADEGDDSTAIGEE